MIAKRANEILRDGLRDVKRMPLARALGRADALPEGLPGEQAQLLRHFDLLPRGLPVRAADLPEPPLRLVGKPVREGDEQLARNPRARSAIMRVAERSAVAWDATP